MTPRDILVGAMVLSVFAVSFAFLRSRTWKGFGIAAFSTLAMVLVGASQVPGAGLVQGGLWAAAMIVLLTKPEWVGVASREEYAFIESYAESMRRFRRPESSMGANVEPDAFLAELNAAIDVLDAAHPPDDWMGLRDDTVRLMRAHIERVKGRDRPTDEEVATAHQKWLALDRRFREITRSTAGFWARLPGRS